MRWCKRQQKLRKHLVLSPQGSQTLKGLSTKRRASVDVDLKASLVLEAKTLVSKASTQYQQRLCLIKIVAWKK